MSILYHTHLHVLNHRVLSQLHDPGLGVVEALRDEQRDERSTAARHLHSQEPAVGTAPRRYVSAQHAPACMPQGCSGQRAASTAPSPTRGPRTRQRCASTGHRSLTPLPPPPVQQRYHHDHRDSSNSTQQQRRQWHAPSEQTEQPLQCSAEISPTSSMASAAAEPPSSSNAVSAA